MKVPREHLTVLLNAFYDQGVTKLSVAHPCEEIGELMEIDISDPVNTTVSFTQGALTYGDSVEEVALTYGETVADDLPDKETYVRALVATGLSKLENQEKVETFLRQHCYPDLVAGHHPIAAGIDTNVMAWRLPDVLEIDPEEYTDENDRQAVNGFALAEGIYEELNWHYKHYDTRSLEDAFGPEFVRLDNQPAGANREGIMGLFEYRRLRDHRYADTIPSNTGDEAIIEAYAKYDTESRKNVVLFSNDYGFIDRAHDHGLLAQHIAYPIDVPEDVTVTWDEVVDILYIISVIFGVLKLPGVTLYGVWNGKRGEDWQHERIDIEARSDGLSKVIARDNTLINSLT